MRRRLLLAVCVTAAVTAVVTTAVNVYVHERPSFGPNVVLGAMRSAVLGELREIIVHLPESYDRSPTRRYPVVYVLDGSSEDVHTASSAALMARIGVVPEVIVVGLPNTSGPNRQRDYTPPFMRRDIDEPDSALGGGDRFLAFLKGEIVPWIDGRYRTEAFRMIAGNSRGGLLVVYSLIADPELFDARFAFSPALWRDDQVIVSKLREALVAREDLGGFLYLSLGDQENEKMMAAYRSAVTALREHAPRRLRWQADLTPGANHRSNAELSTPVGFRALYVGWKPDDGRPQGQPPHHEGHSGQGGE